VRFCWLFLLLLGVLRGYETSAQNYPTYDGYFLNPFIYNPAAAATEQLQINAGYRRQWFGIPGAPSISSLTVNTLMDKTRAGIGFKVSSFSRGFLNSTDASVSYAYGVPLSKATKLFFGLSGGLLSNTINLGELSAISDPALSSASNGISPSASFGMLLKSSNGLNLGFTLPKLFNNLTELDAKYSFSYFDNMIITASFSKWQPQQQTVKRGRGRSYKSKKNANVPLELFTIYRYSSYGGLFEGTGKLNFNSNIWLSATYRQYAGIIPGIGINLENINFSYFYEPGIGGDLPLKTHEVLLTIHLGNKKFRDKAPPPAAKAKTPPPKVVAKKPDPVKKVDEKKPAPVVTAPVVAQDVSHQPRFKRTDPMSNIDNPSDTVATKKAHADERRELDKHIEEHAEGKHDDSHNEPVNERHDFVKRGAHKEELEIGTYVIAGAFQSRANAEHYVNTLKSLGYTDSDFGHLSVRNLWYVFIAQEAQIPKAQVRRNKLQKNRIFKDVWLLTVQE